MDSFRPVPLADVVARRLEQFILEGVLRPGERLASERDLAATLDVSRPSLRDALSKLEQKGLIITGKGGAVVGDFLRRLTDPLAHLFADKPRVTADYFEYRRIVEGQAASLAATRATDPDKAAIRSSLDQIEAAHHLADVSAEASADIDLHVAVYHAAHNVVLLHVMRSLADMLRDNVMFNREQLYKRSGIRDELLAQHRAIAHTILAGDASAAERAAMDHIRFVHAEIQNQRLDDERIRESLRRVARSDLLAG
jgi:GntR family transcriptional regulator, transcriptional repressor for pyruvate dehydrogenase complex